MKLLVTALLLVTTPALADAPSTTIQVDPISWTHRTFAGGIAHAIASRVALRADATVVTAEPTLSGFTSSRAGVTAVLYLDRVFHGPFVEAGGHVRSTPYFTSSMDPTGFDITRERAFDVVAYAGWQWSFSSGLHIAAAIGGSRTLVSSFNWLGGMPHGRESYVRAGFAF